MVFSTAVPEERVKIGTIVLNRRSVCMLKEAERIGGFRLRLVQGSFNAGGVPASKGTHDGGGVFDASVRGLTEDQIRDRVRSLRLAGWAAWHRLSPPFSAPHIHAVAVGDKQLSSAAKGQVDDYKKGKNGLKGHGADPGPKVDPKFFSDAFVARYVTSAPPRFADASMLAFVSGRFQKTQKEFTSDRSSKQIQLVQAALKELGLYPFTVDGKWGRRTQDGYRDWQKRLGVKNATGVVTRPSLEALGRRSGNFRVKNTGAGQLPAPPFPGREFFGPGKVNEHVTSLGKQLVRLGFGRFFKAGPGPRWTDADRKAVEAFQKSRPELRMDADGFPGPLTWRLAHQLPTPRP